eukprot:COSAG01_NODE_15025_length_1383_cov_55.083333_2_plen_352_part_01
MQRNVFRVRRLLLPAGALSAKMWLVAAHVTLLHLALADAIPSPYQLQCSPAHWLNNTALSNPKHHLRSLKGDGTTPESCCAACAADGGRCASWSFWLPDNCLTFTTIAPAKHEVGSVSGATGPLPRPGPPPPPPPVPPAPPLPPSNPGARNIVFFQCDEMDGRTVDPSHPISKVTRKPNLEVMMERGTNFVGQYCNTPLCAPSRSSMFTGRRTSSIEAWSNIKSLMADVADPSKPDPVCAKIVGYGGATGCVELGRRQNVRTTINLAMKDAGFDVRLYGKMDTGGGPLMTPPGAHATVSPRHHPSPPRGSFPTSCGSGGIVRTGLPRIGQLVDGAQTAGGEALLSGRESPAK